MIGTRRELDTRLVVSIIALIVVVIGAIAWWRFVGPSGPQTAKEAGLGKPMHPGEIPGQRGPISAGPMGAPPGK